MIQLIQQALLMGHTVSQVLNFLGSKMPNVAPAVTNARKRGYTDEDILKFLQGKIKVDKKQAERKLSEVEKNFEGAGILNKEEKQERKAKFLQGALGVAGTALGAYGLYNKYSGLFSPTASSQTGPASGGASTPPQPGGPPPTAPSTPAPQSPQGTVPHGAPIPTGQQVATRGLPANPVPNPTPNPLSSIKSNSNPNIPSQNTIETESFPEETYQTPEHKKQQALGKFHNKLRARTLREQLLKDYEDTYGPPSEAIKQLPPEDLEAIVNVVKQPEQLAPGQPNAIQPQNAIGEEQNIQAAANVKEEQPPIHDQSVTETVPPSQEQKPTEPPKLAKGSKVITPSGDFAEIEDLPGKTAKVNVDGKQEVLDSDDLTAVPENEEEILSLYEKLIAKIPENLRSSMLNWVGYDPERNILQVKFHNGSSYTYENIPAEFADKLKDVQFLAKTTGGNYYGNWETGENSRGAGVSALIKELQKTYGGKGKEYSAKFNEVYSFLGLPEEKLREKLKNEREAKKKRKGSA